MSFLIYLLVGLIAGYLADLFVKDELGLLGDLAIGLLGGLLGGFIFNAFNISTAGLGLLGDILVAFVGALVLLALVKAIYRTAHAA